MKNNIIETIIKALLVSTGCYVAGRLIGFPISYYVYGMKDRKKKERRSTTCGMEY